MSSSDVKMLLPDDVIYNIILWLPVISLLRFKTICKSWRALIESSEFIKQHLRRHQYDCSSLKDKNHNLIFFVPKEDPPITFLLTSVHTFEAPTACLQLDSSDLHEYFPVLHDIASFDGIVCFTFHGRWKAWNRNICLWNPATKQSRLLPESPFPLTIEMENLDPMFSVGFGFDVNTNDYKVVKLTSSPHPDEKQVEVYDLSIDSWRNIDSLFLADVYHLSSQIPFHSGNCFCWIAFKSEGSFILCFDFGSEMFRSVSFPEFDIHHYSTDICVVDDKIACVLNEFEGTYTEIWVFNDYGSANESWAKIYKIHPLTTIESNEMFNWVLMNGNYLFFGVGDHLRRYNVVTKEAKDFPVLEFQQILTGYGFHKKCDFCQWEVMQYKESLVSVGAGNCVPPTC